MNRRIQARACAAAMVFFAMCLSGPKAEAAGKRRPAPAPSTVTVPAPGGQPINALTDKDMAAKLEDWTGEPVTAGNDIELLVFGHEFFPKRLRLIREAQRTIDFQSYLWCDDESGLAVANALADAARRGVRVRLIMDWTNVKDHDQAYAIMQGAGIELIKYNSAFWGIGDFNKRLHEKIMIVDGRETLMGGANMCNEYLLDTPQMPLWQDLEFLMRGPITARMQARFDRDWNWMATLDLRARIKAGNFDRVYTVYHEPTPVSAEPVAGGSHALMQHQQPYRRPGEGARYADMFAALALSARESLVLYIPYLAPNPVFKRAILQAARRGVDVKIFTNSKDTNDMAFILANAALTHYGSFLQAGVRIFERNASTLHAKGMMIDGRTVSVGSHNFTHRSFGENGEVNVMTDDPRAVARFKRMAEEDMKTFTEVKAADLLDRANETLEQGGLVIGKWLERLF